MLKIGAEAIHFATGLVVGYPPCAGIMTFKDFFEARCDEIVVVGIHPIPQEYLDIHTRLVTQGDSSWISLIEPIMSDELVWKAYN